MHASDPKRAGNRSPDKNLDYDGTPEVDPNRPPVEDDDRAQLEALFRANIPWLRGWLGARLHGRRRQDADDLCQEILLKAFRSVGTLRRPESFPAWLYQIANNKLRDYLRQKPRREREIQVEADHEDPRRVDDDLVREEEIGRLIEAVLGLPAKYREPMILRHVEDLGYDEIAKILGVTKNNVQVRIFRGRQMLRQTVAGGKNGGRGSGGSSGDDGKRRSAGGAVKKSREEDRSLLFSAADPREARGRC